jgi:hypothetical protein
MTSLTFLIDRGEQELEFNTLLGFDDEKGEIVCKDYKVVDCDTNEDITNQFTEKEVIEYYAQWCVDQV